MSQLTAAEKIVLRDPNGQYTNLYLAKFEPRILFQAQINDASILKGAKVITFDNVITGSYTNLVAGQSVYIGSTQGGLDIGRVRLRSVTASTLTVAVDDSIFYADNQYLTVREFYEIWPVFPFIDLNTGTKVGTEYKDWDIAYSDQNVNFDPIIIMGPDFAGFYEASIALTGVYFTATGTYTVDSSTISSYSWNFPAGCSITGSTSGTPGNVTFPSAGMYTVQLSVTSSAGKTATAHRHIMILNRHNGDDTVAPALNYENISDWEFEEITTDNINGAIAKVIVRNRADEFRDGDLVVIFSEDFYQGSLQSFGGYPGRSNVLFVGYVDKAESEYDAFISKTTFILKGSASYLQNKEMFAIIQIDTQGTPASWREIKNLTINKSLIHYIRWHSTLLNVKDFRKIATAEGAYCEDIIEFQKGELLNNITGFMQQKVLGFCSSDRQGSFRTEIDLQLILTGSRPASVMTLQEGDWLDSTKISEEIENNVSNILLGGIGYDPSVAAWNTGVPLLSRAPGQWPAYVGKTQNVSGLTMPANGQSTLNNISGLYYAKVNNATPELQLEMSYNMGNIDMFPQEFYDFNISGTANLSRGFNWKPKRIIPRKETIKLDKFVLRQTITFEPETYGPPGDTIVIPTTIPGGDCTDCTTPPPCDCATNSNCEGCPPIIGVGDGNTVYVATYNKLARTRNFLSASPNWTDITNVSLPDSIQAFCLYSYDPVNVAFVVTASTVYLVTDLNTNSPTFTSLITNVTAGCTEFQCVNSPICDPTVLWLGWVNIAQTGATRVVFDVASKTRTSFSSVNVGGNVAGNYARRIIGSFTDGTQAWIGTTRGAAYHGFSQRGLLSTLSFSGSLTTSEKYIITGDIDLYDFDAAYPDNGTTMWLAKPLGGITYMKSTDGGTTFTVKTSVAISGAIDLNDRGRLNINIGTNSLDDVTLGKAPGDTESLAVITRTANGGTSFTTPLSSSAVTGGNFPGMLAVGRWPYNVLVVYFLGNSIYYTGDMFATGPVDKIGDWVSVLGTFPIHDPNGPVNIIPLWLAY